MDTLDNPPANSESGTPAHPDYPVLTSRYPAVHATLLGGYPWDCLPVLPCCYGQEPRQSAFLIVAATRPSYREAIPIGCVSCARQADQSASGLGVLRWNTREVEASIPS